MIIVKSEAKTGGKVKIFGLYTNIEWSSEFVMNGFKAGSGDSFLFSLRDDMNFIQLRCKNNKKEVYHRADWLFSLGDDLIIDNDCNINTQSYSLLGSCYEKPTDNEGGGYCLAGS